MTLISPPAPSRRWDYLPGPILEKISVWSEEGALLQTCKRIWTSVHRWEWQRLDVALPRFQIDVAAKRPRAGEDEARAAHRCKEEMILWIIDRRDYFPLWRSLLGYRPLELLCRAERIIAYRESYELISHMQGIIGVSHSSNQTSAALQRVTSIDLFQQSEAEVLSVARDVKENLPQGEVCVMDGDIEDHNIGRIFMFPKMPCAFDPKECEAVRIERERIYCMQQQRGLRNFARDSRSIVHPFLFSQAQRRSHERWSWTIARFRDGLNLRFLLGRAEEMLTGPWGDGSGPWVREMIDCLCDPTYFSIVRYRPYETRLFRWLLEYPGLIGEVFSEKIRSLPSFMPRANPVERELSERVPILQNIFRYQPRPLFDAFVSLLPPCTKQLIPRALCLDIRWIRLESFTRSQQELTALFHQICSQGLHRKEVLDALLTLLSGPAALDIPSSHLLRTLHKMVGKNLLGARFQVARQITSLLCQQGAVKVMDALFPRFHLLFSL